MVERISDGEPAARYIPETTLDSRRMEGFTYLKHLAPGVSLDSGPMEGIDSSFTVDCTTQGMCYGESI